MPTPYKTNLTPEEEKKFRQWYGNYATATGNNANPDAEGQNYDYRGFWKENPTVEISPDMHLSDRYKTPGHETFSDESIYYSQAPDQAGYWDIGGQFVKPLATNAPYSDRIKWIEGRHAARIKRIGSASADELARLNDEYQKTLQGIYDEQKAADETALKGVEDAQKAAEKSGADRLIEMGNELEAQKKEGEAQIENDRKAAIWTGAGELAASIANMIAVGKHNAVSQQYKSYSQDWMQKADRDIKEHRARMDNLNERLRQQKERLDALKQGNAQTLAGMRLAAAGRRTQAQAQLAAAENAGKAKEAEMRTAADTAAAAAEVQAVKDAATQRGNEIQLGQAQQRINAQNDATRLSRIAAGFVPDKSVEGGWRYDPKEAEKKYGVKVSQQQTSGKDKSLQLPIIDANGDVNLVNVQTKEQLDLIMNTAVNAIRKDYGDEIANELQSRLTMAAADKEDTTAILAEWIGKSPTMESELKKIDLNYQGNHGTRRGFTGGQMSSDDFLNALNG